jgi:hypothetical protein
MAAFCLERRLNVIAVSVLSRREHFGQILVLIRRFRKSFDNHRPVIGPKENHDFALVRPLNLRRAGWRQFITAQLILPVIYGYL